MEAHLSIDTEALNRFLNSVTDIAPNLINHPGRLPKIYHYTDLNGLKGILENNDLWLTHSRYSNDDEELTYGLKVVRETIRKKLGDSHGTLKHIKYLENVAKIFEVPPPQEVYICCFCAKDNHLSQWRGYAGNGIGVSLGFATRSFHDITGNDAHSKGLVRLWKVSYKREDQVQLIGRALNFASPDRSGNKGSPEELARQAADAIQFFIPTFKHRDFNVEKEIRLIFTPFPNCETQPRFRVSRGMLVPYYSLKELMGDYSGDQLPIKSVQVGPCPHRELIAESTRMLLKREGLSDIEVLTSDTPYRG